MISKYRAIPIDKPKDSGEFVHGDYIYYLGWTFILPDKIPASVIKDIDVSTVRNIGKMVVEVHSDTVGQYTGRNDKNKVEIYADSRVWIQKYGNGTVFWHDLHCVFYVRMDKKHQGGNLLLLDEDSRRMKVIGTIHDKAEGSRE